MKIDVSDEQLAVLAQMGDRRASELLLNKFKYLVRKICKRYYVAGGTEDDTVQEGMIGLYRAIMSFDPEKNDCFQAFASMCIRRRVMTAMDSANRQKYQPLNTSISLNKPVQEDGLTLGEVIEDDSQNPEKMYISSEKQYNAKVRIKQMLSPLEKRILIQYLQEKTYDEIAKKLGISVKSVDNAIQRIKNKISRLKV